MFVYYECCIYDRTDVSEGLMLIRQVHQKSVIIVTIGIFWNIVLIFNQMYSADAMIY